jgi:hypothetical protein
VLHPAARDMIAQQDYLNGIRRLHNDIGALSAASAYAPVNVPGKCSCPIAFNQCKAREVSDILT